MSYMQKQFNIFSTMVEV